MADHLRGARQQARNATRDPCQRANAAKQAIINQFLARHNQYALRVVTWKMMLRPGWKEALQRLLPYTALFLMLAPFTTVQSDSWCLAKVEGSTPNYLAAWDGPTWSSIMGDTLPKTSEFAGPWSKRGPEWQILAHLPHLTIVFLLLSIYGAWVAYKYWYASQQNVIPPYDDAIVTAACTLLAFSSLMAWLYGVMYYFRASSWDWRPVAESAGLSKLTKRAPGDSIAIGPGLYCAFASPCFARSWFALLLYQQKRAARRLRAERSTDSEKA